MVFLFSACGLQDLVYLAPIEEYRIQGGWPAPNYLDFFHNTDNDAQEFLGYEIFYKFYREDSDTLAQDVVNDKNYFYEKYIRTYSDITGRGFFRMNRNIDRLTPLVNILYTDSVSRKIRINFVGLDIYPTDPVLELTVFENDGITAKENFYLKRDVIDNLVDDELKDFIPSEIVAGDSDVASMPAGFNAAGKGLVISVCVVAYGWSIDSGPLFSEVIFLNSSADNAMRIRFN